jgi:hypothetical protein
MLYNLIKRDLVMLIATARKVGNSIFLLLPK